MNLEPAVLGCTPRDQSLSGYSLSQSAAIYLNLAVVEYDLLLYPEALKHAKAYVVHPSADPARVEKLKKEMIPELQAKTGHVAVQGQPGEAVFVDGEKIGIAPISDTVDVAPGEHTVACGTVTRTVIVKAGDSATVIVIKETTTFTTAPASTQQPQNPPPASSGQQSPPPPGDDTQKPNEGGMGRWIGPIALGAVGVGGVVTGAVFAASSNSAKNEQQTIQNNAGGHACAPGASTCDAYKSKGSDASTAATISVVGYSVGAVGLIVGALWAYRNTQATSTASAPPARAAVAPWIDPKSGGMNVVITY